MISRRGLLSGLLAAPAVIAVENLMPLRGVKFDGLQRLRNWHAILEPDRSVSFVNDGQRYLTSWLNQEHIDDGFGPAFDDIKSIIESDISAVNQRSNPWSELSEFEKKFDISVERDGIIWRSEERLNPAYRKFTLRKCPDWTPKGVS